MLNEKIDFYVKAKTDKIKILFLTDMQVIDAAQRRFNERLTENEIKIWDISRIKENLFDEMDAVIKETSPDLIIITGDIVYGEFDDKGTTLISFIEKMESYGIAWSPVWGNHDNESKMTAKWQCEQLLRAKHCLFKVGKVYGTGNYSIGLLDGNGELYRIIYLLFSHCSCVNGVREQTDFTSSQIKWIINLYKSVSKDKKDIPCFLCFHIPPIEFCELLTEKGVFSDKGEFRTFSFDGTKGEFGEIKENPASPAYFKIREILDKIKVDGIFFGHHHTNNCSIVGNDGVRWTYVLKTGTYDYHDEDKLGGTLVEALNCGSFNVRHVYHRSKNQ